MLFRMRLFLDPSCRGCAFSCLFSPHCAEFMYTHRVRANAGFLHKDLFAQRAPFDVATLTLPVIWPNGPNKWCSLVPVVTGAKVTDMDEQCVWSPSDVAQQHRMADSACDCSFRRSKQQLVPVPVCFARADLHR